MYTPFVLSVSKDMNHVPLFPKRCTRIFLKHVVLTNVVSDSTIYVQESYGPPIKKREPSFYECSNMTTPIQLLVFTVNEQQYALRLASVERIVRAVEVTPLPESSSGLLGVVNVQGHIVPAVDFRKRFGLPDREIEISDRLIIANASDRTIALLVDAVVGVVASTEEEVVPSAQIGSGMESSEGMIKLGEEMVLIPNFNNIVEA